MHREHYQFARRGRRLEIRAQRLLKEAGQENLSFELLNRNVDQPYKYVGTWLVDEWSKIGVKVTQKVVPTGPWFEVKRLRAVTSRDSPSE